jgi:hypothetical protein
MTRMNSNAQPRCPLRLGENCTLCVPGVDGPQNCGLVYLVQSDPDLRAELENRRQEVREAAKALVRQHR